MSKNGILDKVNFLFSVAKKGNCTEEEFHKIMDMTTEHSNNLVLGRVFGYSISDYAIATLRWIGSDKLLNEFESIFSQLTNERKRDIEELISKKVYLEV